ncbi:choice-of-anchor Q domain-containing protein [Spirosoma areae]
MKKIPLLLLLAGLSCRTLAVNYYVSALGTNANDGKSEANPFLTIQKAADLTMAGDTVFLLNGVYKSTSGPILNISRSGTAAGYITYKPLKGHTPKLTASGNVWNAVSINGSYIVFEGVELIGNNANLTYEGAMASYTEAKNGGTNWSAYANFNTNGVSIGGPNKESKFPHHVTIRNCSVHDFPGGGISSIQADYTTIENNVVYNNAWYMMYAGSGISILTPVNSDKVTTYKNIVRNNVCFTNKTTIPWISLGRLSDGNGIIIDVNQHGYDNQSATVPNADEAYTGRTLVENNLSVNNGGSGIHAFKADHVDIINNTAYNNGTVVGYADIFANTCKDVNVLNNIMYSRDGGDCNATNKNVDVVYDYNVYFSGKVAVKGTHDVIADPQFVNPSTDRALANFKVKSTSPAIDRGSSTAGQFSQTDILGVKRPQGTLPDMGAYEFQAQAIITALAEPIETIRVSPNPVENRVTITWVPVRGAKGRVEIVNCLGQRLLEEPLNETTNQLSTQKLTTGLYLLLIYRDDNLISVRKLMKQ